MLFVVAYCGLGFDNLLECKQAVQYYTGANEFIWFYLLLASRLNIGLERFEVGVYA